VLRREEDLAALDATAIRLPGAAAPLLDVRETWREKAPESVYARFHHKKRAYVLGDRVRTEHLFFSKHPVVSAASSTFTAFHVLPRLLHGVSRWLAGDALREDLAYWRRIEEHRDEMCRAASVLGLGFAAIDYSERADGSLVLWEANPHPFLPPLEAMRLPRQRLAAERLESYQDAIADFLARLVDASVEAGAPATRESGRNRCGS
jgi:hypothetical protein